MDNKKEYAKKFFDAIMPEEGEKYGKVYSDEQIKKIISDAFVAGQNYQRGEHDVYYGGKENIYFDRKEYINSIITK